MGFNGILGSALRSSPIGQSLTSSALGVTSNSTIQQASSMATGTPLGSVLNNRLLALRTPVKSAVDSLAALAAIAGPGGELLGNIGQYLIGSNALGTSLFPIGYKPLLTPSTKVHDAAIGSSLRYDYRHAASTQHDKHPLWPSRTNVDKNQFVEMLNSGGVASPARYKLMIGSANFGDSRLVGLMAKDVTLPSKTFGVALDRRGGYLYKNPNGISYGVLSVAFIVDEDRKVLDFFDRWLAAVYPDEGSNTFNYMTTYAKQISLIELGYDGRARRETTFFDTWPTTIGDISLSYESSNTIEIVNIQFTCSHYSSKLVAAAPDQSATRVPERSYPPYTEPAGALIGPITTSPSSSTFI